LRYVLINASHRAASSTLAVDVDSSSSSSSLPFIRATPPPHSKHATYAALAGSATSSSSSSLSLFICDAVPAIKARLLGDFSLQFLATPLLQKNEQELATLCVAPQTWLLRTGWQKAAMISGQN
jgi:hypothetical protein